MPASFMVSFKIAALILFLFTVAWVAKTHFRSPQAMRDPRVCTPAIKQRIEKVCGKGLIAVATIDYLFLKKAVDASTTAVDWDAKRTAIDDKYERLEKAITDKYTPQVQYLWSLNSDSPVERDHIEQKIANLNAAEERDHQALRAQKDQELAATYTQEQRAEEVYTAEQVQAMQQRNKLTRECLALYDGPEKPCLFSTGGWKCTKADMQKMRSILQDWPVLTPLPYAEGENRAFHDAANESLSLNQQWNSIFQNWVAHCEQQLQSRAPR